MADQMTSFPVVPDPAWLATTNARKAIPNIDGPIGPRLAAQIEQRGGQIPVGADVNTLRAILNELESKPVEATFTKQDRLRTRFHAAWNLYVPELPKARNLGVRPTAEPEMACVEFNVTVADCERIESLLRELQHDISVFESMTPEQREIAQIKRQNFYMSIKLREAIDVINQHEGEIKELRETIESMRRPNRLSAPVLLATSNDGGSAA